MIGTAKTRNVCLEWPSPEFSFQQKKVKHSIMRTSSTFSSAGYYHLYNRLTSGSTFTCVYSHVCHVWVYIYNLVTGINRSVYGLISVPLGAKYALFVFLFDVLEKVSHILCMILSCFLLCYFISIFYRLSIWNNLLCWWITTNLGFSRTLFGEIF